MKSFVRRLFDPGPWAVDEDPYGIPSPERVLGGRGQPATRVTTDTALRHIDVYKCVSLISDTVAMLPQHAFRKTKRPTGVVREPLDPQPSVIEAPSPEMLPFDYCQRWANSMLLRGNAYELVTARDPTFGRPVFTQIIHPSAIRKVERSKVDGLPRYVMEDGTEERHVLAGGDMLHVPGFVLPGELVGLSPIELGMYGIGLSMAAESFGSNWFADGAHPSGVIEYESDVEDPDPSFMDELKDRFEQSTGGLLRRRVVVLGNAKWRPIQVTPNESQFLETRRFQSAQIAGLYRVPPHLVSDVDRSTSWGSGIEEQGHNFVTYTLGPWVTRLEQARSLLVPRGNYVKVKVDALLRGRLLDRYRSYAIGRQWGWLSINDIRALEDLAPIGEDGDTYLQPMNMTEVGDAMSLLLDGDS